MANTLGIQEVTLAQIADDTHIINAVDLTGAVAGTPRKSVYEPAVVRVTNHDDDDGGTTDYADGMALFVSVRHGEPWCKEDGTLEKIIHTSPNGASVAAPANATTIFPSFDYTTF